MAAAPERKQLHAWVSVDSFNGWQATSLANGVNTTALVDAVGRLLAEVDGRRTPAWLASCVEEARKIAAERSTRRPST